MMNKIIELNEQQVEFLKSALNALDELPLPLDITSQTIRQQIINKLEE